MKQNYYIAYGSNLNVQQMARRCPTATPVGTGVLEGWRLEFRGSGSGAYLTIVPFEGGRVPVGIWRISEADERALDRYEGCPHFYSKRKIKVQVKAQVEDFGSHRLRSVSALVYIMREDAAPGVPDPFYVHVCREGYSDFGFDEAELYAALNRAGEEVIE